MKWREAVFRNILLTIAVTVCLSVITYQSIRFDVFDLFTVLLLTLILLMYVFFLYIWKDWKELIEKKNDANSEG